LAEISGEDVDVVAGSEEAGGDVEHGGPGTPTPSWSARSAAAALRREAIELRAKGVEWS
jgi:hypothetical protein